MQIRIGRFANTCKLWISVIKLESSNIWENYLPPVQYAGMYLARLNPSVGKTWPVGGWGWTARISDPASNSSDASRLSRRNNSDPSELRMPPTHPPTPDQRCANADQINTRLPPHDPIFWKKTKLLCFCYFWPLHICLWKMTIMKMTTVVETSTNINMTSKNGLKNGSQLRSDQQPWPY